MPKPHPHASPADQRRAALWERRLAVEEVFRQTHFHRPLTFRERTLDLAAHALRIGLRITGLHARGRRNADAVRLATQDIAYPDLPQPLDGLRILHGADPHFGASPRFNDMLCARTSEAPCDLCVLTGDFRFMRVGQMKRVREGIRALVKAVRSRHGVYAVLGNHDESAFVPILEGFGVRMLTNRHELLRFRGAAVCLAGVDDPHMFRCADVATALEGAPPDAFRILLAHSPEAVEEAAAHGVRLYLCGHTHGGQIRFPGVGAVMLNTRAKRRHAQGRWRVGEMEGYTSPGAGTSNIPVRFNCPPETTLIRLIRR